MKPRLFWTRVHVRRVDGSEETWFVHAAARRQDPFSTYDVEIDIDAYRQKTAEEMAESPIFNQKIYKRWAYKFAVTKDEAAFAHRNWRVDQGPMSVTRDDGYDFGTLGSAVWMMMEKAVDASLQSIHAEFELHHKVSGTRLSERPESPARYTEPHYQLVSYVGDLAGVPAR